MGVLTTIVCQRCGEECERRSPSQKYCRACSLEVRREDYRRWCVAHPAEARAKSREWREANSEKARAAVARWNAANPERAREFRRAYRARKRAARRAETIGTRA
jgi:hypothetical protein